MTLDRTNWKFGKVNINILVIGVIYKGLSLPLLWVFLGDKRGNSSQIERIDLLKRYIRLFGASSIEFLTADREFVGEQWWQFLIDHKIRIFIRMRANMQVSVPHKGIVKAFWLFNALKLNAFYQHPKIVQVKGCSVYISGLKFVSLHEWVQAREDSARDDQSTQSSSESFPGGTKPCVVFGYRIFKRSDSDFTPGQPTEFEKVS